MTLFELSAAGNPLPTAAPSAGVITSWKVNLTAEVGPLVVPQTLSVLRADATAKTAQVIGSATANVPGGAQQFPTRIPIQAGDRLAISGPEPLGTLYCEEAGGATLGFIPGTAPVGSTAPYGELPTEARIPVSALVEPDADNDGFGDETQDKCPGAAAVQTECPVAILDTFSVPKKRAITVVVSSTVTGPVTLSAKARLPKAGKGTASTSAVAAFRPVTRTVTVGTLSRFTLKIPANLRAALSNLSKGKSVKVKITASATNIAGQLSRDVSRLKLKG